MIVTTSTMIIMNMTSEVNWTVMPYEDYWRPEATANVAALAILIVVAAVGNISIVTFLSCRRRRRSPVNAFLVHLAMGDLAVCCVTMSSEMTSAAFGEWVLGAAACKLVLYAQIVTLAGTVFILVAMSYDRYIAICHVLRFRGGSSKARVRRTIVFAWTLALVSAVPQLFVFVQVQEGIRPNGHPVYVCRSRGYTAWWQRKLYIAWQTLYILIGPTIFIAFCYINIVIAVWRQAQQSQQMENSEATKSSSQLRLAVRRMGYLTPCALRPIVLRKTNYNAHGLSRAKIRTIKLTLCIIASFVGCWAPYFVVTNIRVFSHYEVHVPSTIMAAAHSMALLNSALNPLIYGCFHLRMKHGCREACQDVCCPTETPTRTQASLSPSPQNKNHSPLDTSTTIDVPCEECLSPGHDRSVHSICCSNCPSTLPAAQNPIISVTYAPHIITSPMGEFISLEVFHNSGVL